MNVVQHGETFVKGLYPPIAVTEQGAKVRDLYTIVFVIAVAIFLVVEGLIIWTVIRYRRKPGDDTLPPQTHGNNIAEFIWTVVPTLIVIFMFVISWQTLNVVDTTSARPRRPGSGPSPASSSGSSTTSPRTAGPSSTPSSCRPSAGGGMYVPAGRTIQLSLASQDVIHAFYVPQFLFKRDVVPGRVNTFEFKVNDTDAGQTFRGQCAELCGTGHCDHALRRHRQDRPRVRRMARSSRSPSTTRRRHPPRAARRAARRAAAVPPAAAARRPDGRR